MKICFYIPDYCSDNGLRVQLLQYSVQFKKNKFLRMFLRILMEIVRTSLLCTGNYQVVYTHVRW